MAESSPKRKMVHIFKWYFWYTTELALAGKADGKVNFQVHTGPALGAFNRWVKGTRLQNWRARHVDEIGYAIMAGAEEFINQRYAVISGNGMPGNNVVPRSTPIA